MRCDAAWFRATFLEETCPAGLGGTGDIWPYVKVKPSAEPEPKPEPEPEPQPLTPTPTLTLTLPLTFKGFNEYDGLATIAAATLLSPDLFATFFVPYSCPHTGTHVIGISKARYR